MFFKRIFNRLRVKAFHKNPLQKKKKKRKKKLYNNSGAERTPLNVEKKAHFCLKQWHFCLKGGGFACTQ